MKPFNTVQEAMEWISRNASALCEVYIFTSDYLLSGRPIEVNEAVAANRLHNHFVFD